MYKFTRVLSVKSTSLYGTVKSAMSTSVAKETVRSTTASGSQVYESKRAVFEYLFFHYGDEDVQMPYEFGPKESLNFPARCAQVCIRYSNSGEKPTRALDIGCAVGASSFELARKFNEVIGIDFSQHFIDAANIMKSDGQMDFELLVRGKVYEHATAKVADSIDRAKVRFEQGDACNLPESLGNINHSLQKILFDTYVTYTASFSMIVTGKFDVILASNLLCRLPNPRKFLDDVPKFLNHGAKLVLISPYSWLQEYTAQEAWIGGRDSNPDSASEISKILSSNFILIHRENMPFLIREHERKFQYGVSDCMVWQMK